jgi:hypothetical protein
VGGHLRGPHGWQRQDVADLRPQLLGGDFGLGNPGLAAPLRRGVGDDRLIFQRAAGLGVVVGDLTDHVRHVGKHVLIGQHALIETDH